MGNTKLPYSPNRPPPIGGGRSPPSQWPSRAARPPAAIAAGGCSAGYCQHGMVPAIAGTVSGADNSRHCSAAASFRPAYRPTGIRLGNCLAGMNDAGAMAPARCVPVMAGAVFGAGRSPGTKSGEVVGPCGALRGRPGASCFRPACGLAGWHPAGLWPGWHVRGKGKREGGRRVPSGRSPRRKWCLPDRSCSCRHRFVFFGNSILSGQRDRFIRAATE